MYVTSREVRNTKYVANFHTKAAADEFEEFLKSLIGVDREMVGVTRVRNSIVYTMECFKKGYTLAKQFEDDYIARMSPKPAAQPDPEPVQEPDINVAEPVEAVAETVVSFEEAVIDPIQGDVFVDESENNTEVEESLTIENETEDQKPSPIGNKLTGFFKGNNKFNNN